MLELERGSTETKPWKDVKRKRVRIPDLVYRACGLRVESRAKTKAELSMSHSPTDAVPEFASRLTSGLRVEEHVSLHILPREGQ